MFDECFSDYSRRLLFYKVFYVLPVAAALTTNLVDQGVENGHKPLHRYGHGHVDTGGNGLKCINLHKGWLNKLAPGSLAGKPFIYDTRNS